jgi:hypothetical protein
MSVQFPEHFSQYEEWIASLDVVCDNATRLLIMSDNDSHTYLPVLKNKDSCRIYGPNRSEAGEGLLCMS